MGLTLKGSCLRSYINQQTCSPSVTAEIQVYYVFVHCSGYYTRGSLCRFCDVKKRIANKKLTLIQRNLYRKTIDGISFLDASVICFSKYNHKSRRFEYSVTKLCLV